MADTETVKLNAEEQKAVVEAQKITSDFVKRIGQPGAMDVPVDQLVADNGARVLITVLRPFVLTLNDHRRVKFSAGINDVPMKSLGQVVAEHDYVKANGGKIYTAPRSVVALGSKTLQDPVEIGKDRFPLAQFIAAAHASTGLSIEAWNGLPEEERDDVIAGIIKARKDSVTAKKS